MDLESIEIELEVPELCVGGFIDNTGHGIGFLSYKATIRHRVSRILDKIGKDIEDAAAKVRKAAVEGR